MPPSPEEIQWSDLNNIYTPSKLLKEFGETGRLPVIVQVVKGHHGENTVDCINTDQVLLVTSFESQRRVIARDRHGRLISMPEQWPVKFRVRETGVKRSKPKTLQEIFRDYSHKLPVNAYFDKLPKWSFKAGKKTKSNLKYGGVEILSLYTEIFMKGMPIHNGIISVYERELITLPLYVLVHMRVAQGLIESNQAEWQKVKDKYMDEVKHINFNKVHGSSDVLLYDHRFYMFYEALKKEIHPEEMSFHFSMPSDHVTTEMNPIYGSVERREDRNNNTAFNKDSKDSAPVFDEKVDEVPTVTVTEDQVSKTQRAEKVAVIQTAQVRQNTEQNAPVTNPEPVVTQSETNHKPSTTQGGSSTQPETVQKKQMVESDVSSVQGEVIDTQTEIDEKGRKTTVSIQVVNTEDDHYHSTDSGIQTNSPQNISPQHQPHARVIDINANSPQKTAYSTEVSHLSQDEQISYPRGQIDIDGQGTGIINDETLLSQGGPHISKVVWVEPTKQAPAAYQSYQAQVDQPMKFHLSQTETQSNQADLPALSQSYTDVRTPSQKAVYFMRSDRPVNERISSSRSIHGYPARYQLSSSNSAINRSRPSYPSSSSSVFYSLKKNEPMVDMRDTVSDIGMVPNRGHYRALHVDIPDNSHTHNDAFDRYYNVNRENSYLLGPAQQRDRPGKQRSHSAKRHYDITPRQQVHVIDRQDNKNLYPPTYVDRKGHRSSSTHFPNSPGHSPVRVIHMSRDREANRSSSFVDVITGKIVRKKSSMGDEVDSKFEFRSLGHGNQNKRKERWTREVPLTHSDDEDDTEGTNHYTRSYHNRYRSPSPRATRQYGQAEEPLIKVHGPGVEMISPGYSNSSHRSYQRNDQNNKIASEVKEEIIVPKKMKSKRYDPAPLAPRETSSVSSLSESDNEVKVHHGIYKSSVHVGGRVDEHSSKTSTDSFSPKDSTLTSASVEQLTPRSMSPSTNIPEPLTPTKTYRTSHTVFKTDMGSHSQTVHSQTVEDITDEKELQDLNSIASQSSKKESTRNTAITTHNETSKVVMREKRNRTDGKRSSTNSLRQVYSENRDSIEGSNIGLSVVNKEDPTLQDALNSPSMKLNGESLKGTTRSSGYGSLSSKTEEQKVVKRNKSTHVQHQNDIEKMPQNYDRAVRDSILSIKELDEFLKTQVAVESDSESTKEPDVQISRL